MKLHTETATMNLIGFLFDRSPGYKKVFAVYLWKWNFAIEFGKGDPYDWQV